MLVELIAAARRPALIGAIVVIGAACAPDMPDAPFWKKTHGVYPNVSNTEAAAACENQARNALGQLHGSKSEELYVACMEAFGFTQVSAKEAAEALAAQ